jgi:hypothetical protein
MSVVTLGQLFRVGLDGESTRNQETIKRFQNWQGSTTPVYADEAEAREQHPGAFRSVETRWGRAAYVRRDYHLLDGRVVAKVGVTWTVPEPGGEDAVFFFLPPEQSRRQETE